MNRRLSLPDADATLNQRSLLTFVILTLVATAFVTVSGAESYSYDWVRQTEHAAFSPRDTAEGVVFGGKMWLSNSYLTGGTLLRDLWSSTDCVTWSLITINTPYGSHFAPAAVAFKGRRRVMGGFDNRHRENFDEVWWTEDGTQWQRL